MYVILYVPAPLGATLFILKNVLPSALLSVEPLGSVNTTLFSIPACVPKSKKPPSQSTTEVPATKPPPFVLTKGVISAELTVTVNVVVPIHPLGSV